MHRIEEKIEMSTSKIIIREKHTYLHNKIFNNTEEIKNFIILLEIGGQKMSSVGKEFFSFLKV